MVDLPVSRARPSAWDSRPRTKHPAYLDGLPSGLPVQVGDEHLRVLLMDKALASRGALRWMLERASTYRPNKRNH